MSNLWNSKDLNANHFHISEDLEAQIQNLKKRQLKKRIKKRERLVKRELGGSQFVSIRTLNLDTVKK
jgi:hypothetical protein